MNHIIIKANVNDMETRREYVHFLKKFVRKTSKNIMVFVMPEVLSNNVVWDTDYNIELIDYDLIDNFLLTAHEGYIEFYTYSRRSPPENALKRLSSLYPFLIINCTHCEPKYEFAGFIQFVNGTVFYEKCYDSKNKKHYEIYSNLLADIRLDYFLYDKKIASQSKVLKKLLQYITDYRKKNNIEIE